MPNTIAKFWSEFSPKAGELNLHLEDRKWFELYQWKVQNQPTLTFDQFIRSDRFGKLTDQLHLSLIPAPFVGNLEKAEVVILLMNPGLVPSDYYAEENQAFREACIRNLHQSNIEDEFPFHKLNPEFAWSGGFIWWEARMRPILSKLMKTGKFSNYYDALAFLSKKIATVELVPYHSADGDALSGPGKLLENLPSAREARGLVQRLCEAKEKPLILVLRSHEHWKLNTHTECACTICPVLRRPTLNPNIDGPNGVAGKSILQKLGIA
jgi:hypothetical protein